MALTLPLDSTPKFYAFRRFHTPPPSIASSHRFSVAGDRRNGRKFRPRRRPRVSCDLEVRKIVRRKCAPYLESALVTDGSDAGSHVWKSIPDIIKWSAERYGDRLALVDPYHGPNSMLSYKQLEQEILNFSEGLRVVGLEPEEKVALFADNSCRWLIADLGSMATGAINVVRGSRSSDGELLQIYRHSESIALIVDNPQLYNRLAQSFLWSVKVRFVVLLWGDKSALNISGDDNMPLYNYDEIIKCGQESRNSLLHSFEHGQTYLYDAINPGDVAAIMYTSGTSGMPKGVMLTHENFLHQIENLREVVPSEVGDRTLSMLPPWHAYERTVEYYILTRGHEQVYTNVKNLKADLQFYQPQYVVSVPLVYETLYSSIQKQISSSVARKVIAQTFIKISMLYMKAKNVYEGKVLSNKPFQRAFILVLFDFLWASILAASLWPLHKIGTKLLYCKIQSAVGITKAGISGGGSLPMYIDYFFEAIGIKIQNGYGLTETSPVVAARLPNCNVLGTVGHPLNHTEIKVVDPETAEALPDGSKGIIKLKGPQVMKGYYKNPTATNEVLDEEGWFNTGDIGWIVPKHPMGRSRKCGGMLVLEGRAKDTIVLTTGENVDPRELEEAAIRSSLIQQILIIGQDQRRLGALIVPNKDELLDLARNRSLINDDSDLSNQIAKTLLYEELQKWMADFSFQVGPILLLDEPFTIDNGLMTPTMKIRRDKVVEKYSQQIKDLYKTNIFGE